MMVAVVGTSLTGLEAIGSLAVVLHLQLDGHVADAEPLQLGPHALEGPGVVGQQRDDGVAAHGHYAAGDGPDMQVVHVPDPGHAQQPTPDVAQGEVARHGFKEDVGALPYQPPGPCEDQE